MKVTVFATSTQRHTPQTRDGCHASLPVMKATVAMPTKGAASLLFAAFELVNCLTYLRHPSVRILRNRASPDSSKLPLNLV